MKLLKIYNKILKRIHSITWNGQRSIFMALHEEAISYLLRSHMLRRIAKVIVSGGKGDKIIFLCGCFNSGTTIMRDVLGSHPSIKKTPREGVVYTRLLSDYEVEEWARCWCERDRIEEINTVEFSDLSADALLSDWRFWMPKRGWFLEKSIANLARMRQLEKLFPDARFIVISRDPLPVIEGITRRTKALVENPNGVYTDNMAFDQWKLCKDFAEEQVNLLTHCHQLTYERFVEAPDVEINKILNFLDLEPSASYENPYLRIGDINWQIRNGNQDSIKAVSDERISKIRNRLEINGY